MKVMMHKVFLLLVIICCYANRTSAQSQAPIDSSNYYRFISRGENLESRGLTMNWLRLNEVVPIIMDELQKAGHDWLYDYALFQIDTGKYVVLAAYSRKSNIGFVYEQGHSAFPKKEHRDATIHENAMGIARYSYAEYNAAGEVEFRSIDKLPKNIFLLNENCYWYQYNGNPEDEKKLVTKAIAFNILRQDIRRYLATALNP